MFKLKTWFWTLGLVFTQTFLVFVVYNLLNPSPVYIHWLETVLPGFKWLSFKHLLLGIAESFIYGAYIAVVFVPIHNFFYVRHDQDESAGRGGKAVV
jgi:hypothetical protein